MKLRTPQESNGYFTRAEWYTLPLNWRQLWWKETNYDRGPPSQQLLDEIRAALTTTKQEAEATA